MYPTVIFLTIQLNASNYWYVSLKIEWKHKPFVDTLLNGKLFFFKQFSLE